MIIQQFIGEFIGTMVLILLGNGVVANVVLSKTKGHNSGWIVITAGWGFAVAIAAYLVGPISGAHLNPAVSFAMLLQHKLTISTFGMYVLAQMLGAMLGAILVFMSYKKHYDSTQNEAAILATFATGAEIPHHWWNLVTEIVGTAVLILGIMGINQSANAVAGMGAFLVGILVWSIGLSLGGATGYAINPARDLGPRIIHFILPIKNKGNSQWAYAWVPFIGPLLGALVAVYIGKMIF